MRSALTPFYDVLSAQPAFDKRQIPHKSYKLAMSAGKSRKYRIVDIAGRDFVQTGREGGMGPALIGQVIHEILEETGTAPARALSRMPADFAKDIHESVAGAIADRRNLLESGLAEL